MKHKLLKHKKWLITGITAITIISLLVAFIPVKTVTIQAAGVEFKVPAIFVRGEQYLAVEANTTISANTGEAEYVEPVIRQGGIDIREVSFEDGLTVDSQQWNEPYNKWTDEAMLTYLETHTAAELEQVIESELQELIGEENYVAIHFYSVEPLKYTTRFSVNPIEGEWWD